MLGAWFGSCNISIILSQTRNLQLSSSQYLQKRSSKTWHIPGRMGRMVHSLEKTKANLEISFNQCIRNSKKNFYFFIGGGHVDALLTHVIYDNSKNAKTIYLLQAFMPTTNTCQMAKTTSYDFHSSFIFFSFLLKFHLF